MIPTMHPKDSIMKRRISWQTLLALCALALLLAIAAGPWRSSAQSPVDSATCDASLAALTHHLALTYTALVQEALLPDWSPQTPAAQIEALDLQIRVLTMQANIIKSRGDNDLGLLALEIEKRKALQRHVRPMQEKTN